jgi:hypothetical protein
MGDGRFDLAAPDKNLGRARSGLDVDGGRDGTPEDGRQDYRNGARGSRRSSL